MRQDIAQPRGKFFLALEFADQDDHCHIGEQGRRRREAIHLLVVTLQFARAGHRGSASPAQTQRDGARGIAQGETDVFPQ